MATPRRKTPKPSAASPPADAIVLSGPPGLLRATVSVENGVDQRLTVRGLALHRDGHPTVTGAGVAIIAPGATADVPVTFRLDPGTLPGEYPAEVEVGGLRRAAVLRVEQALSMRVQPRRVLAEVGRQALALTVSNDGNVSIPLAGLVRARTDDGGQDPGPDVTLTLEHALTLDPATTVAVHAVLVVPEDLDPSRRHTARIPVGTADLDVIILPRTASETPS